MFKIFKASEILRFGCPMQGLKDIKGQPPKFGGGGGTLVCNICDVIKQNESEVANIDFKIQANKVV